jgi:hypothetical protein
LTPQRLKESGNLRLPFADTWQAPYVKRPGGDQLGAFGHLGAYTSELLVQEVREVQLKSDPTFDYSKMVFRGRADELHK